MCWQKNFDALARRRPVVNYLHDTYRVGERRACRVARIPVSTFRYESRQERGRRCDCGFERSHKSECAKATAKSGCC